MLLESSLINIKFPQLPHHGSYKMGHVAHCNSASSRNRAWPTGTGSRSL